MLPEDKWISFQSLSLELHTIAAELEYTLGNVDIGEELCPKVLGREDCYREEISFALRILRVHALFYTRMQYNTTIEACLSLLRELGFNFPLNNLDLLEGKALTFWFLIQFEDFWYNPLHLLLKKT